MPLAVRGKSAAGPLSSPPPRAHVSKWAHRNTATHVTWRTGRVATRTHSSTACLRTSLVNGSPGSNPRPVLALVVVSWLAGAVFAAVVAAAVALACACVTLEGAGLVGARRTWRVAVDAVRRVAAAVWRMRHTWVRLDGQQRVAQGRCCERSGGRAFMPSFWSQHSAARSGTVCARARSTVRPPALRMHAAHPCVHACSQTRHCGYGTRLRARNKAGTCTSWPPCQ